MALSTEKSRQDLVPWFETPLEADLMSLDYDLSTLEVYTKVGMSLLLSDTEVHRIPLQILPLAGIGYERVFTNLLTWAPDWSRPPEPFILSFDRGHGVNYRASGISSDMHYKLVGVAPAIRTMRSVGRRGSFPWDPRSTKTTLYT